MSDSRTHLLSHRARLLAELRDVESLLYKSDPTPHPEDCRGCQSWDAPVHLYVGPTGQPVMPARNEATR